MTKKNREINKNLPLSGVDFSGDIRFKLKKEEALLINSLCLFFVTS